MKYILSLLLLVVPISCFCQKKIYYTNDIKDTISFFNKHCTNCTITDTKMLNTLNGPCLESYKVDKILHIDVINNWKYYLNHDYKQYISTFQDYIRTLKLENNFKDLGSIEMSRNFKSQLISIEKTNRSSKDIYLINYNQDMIASIIKIYHYDWKYSLDREYIIKNIDESFSLIYENLDDDCVYCDTSVESLNKKLIFQFDKYGHVVECK